MTAPTLVSVSAYARLHGVAKAAAQKWQARGHLAMRDGKVWVENSDRNLQHAGLGRYGDAAGKVVAPPATPEPVAEVAAALDPADETAVLSFLDELLAGRFANAAQAAEIKENALAAKHLLEVRRRAGALVEIELAEQALFETFRSFRDALLNFPSRVAPLLAADLNVDAEKVSEALAAHVHQQLADLGEPSLEIGEAEPASA